MEITAEVTRIVKTSRIRTGLCTVFCCHTSASLVIQENADPSVKSDVLRWLQKLAPDGDPSYEHDSEGPDDMSAHLRSVITRSSEVIPITNSRLALGTWQGLYLAEHRTRPHRRRIVVHITGEP